MAQAKVRITWNNRLEKFASEQDRAQGKVQQVVLWEKEDIVPLDVALALGFDIDNQRENKGKTTEIQQDQTKYWTHEHG